MCVELCGERLHYELPREPSRWRFARVTLRGVPERPVPGHPDAASLLARLTCQPGASVTRADVAADLRLLARTGLFADVAAAVRSARRVFARPVGGGALAAEAEAEALILSVTPRQLRPFDSYVVALAPELRAKYPPAGGGGSERDAPPHLPWLPAFHATFAALMEEASAQRAGRDLTGLEMCCVVRACDSAASLRDMRSPLRLGTAQAREAVARAGRAHTAAAGVASAELAVAPRCERDGSRPDALIVALEPPPPRVAGDAPGSDGDAWDAAGEAALREEGSDRRAAKAAADAAAAALQLPHSPPRRAARRRRSAAAMLSYFDGAALDAALTPITAAHAFYSWWSGVRYGCDMFAALAAAADVGAPRVFCIDRPQRVTSRRLGTLLRRTLGAKLVAAAAFAAATARLVPTYWPLVLLGVAAAGCAYATFELRRRLAAAGGDGWTFLLSFMRRSAAPLLTERDVIMAGALRRIAAAAPPPHLARLRGAWEGPARAGRAPVRYTLLQRAAAGDTDEYQTRQHAVVAVVGMAHIRGIVIAWYAGWRRWKMRAAFAARSARRKPQEAAGGVSGQVQLAD